MRRLFAAILAAVMLMIPVSLGACSSGSGQTSDSISETDVTVETSAGTGLTPTSSSTEQKVPQVTADGSYISANYTEVSGKTVQKYSRLTNLPTLYITLNHDKSIEDVQHGVYTAAKYTFVSDYVEDSYYELPMQIKGRGNYSWSFYQKPYALKLGEKADFLGMGAAKKWILITVSSDKTMLKNYMTQTFAKELGLPGTCENAYIDVVVNGSYHGTYVLTEKIEVKDSRINIPEDKGVLFEIEMVYRHSCENCVLLYKDKRDPSNSIHLELKYYKGIDIETWERSQQTSAINWLQKYFDRLANAMQGGDFATLQKYMDIDSFVDWYLVNEITRNYDSAFVTSCYCFIDEKDILHMGPCWDYDTCYGSQFPDYEIANVREAPWYKWMFTNCPEFVELVKARWNELRKEGGAIDKFLADIDVNREYIKLSEQLEHRKYPHSEVGERDDYDRAINYLKDWLDKRLAWLDKDINGL